MLLGESGVDAVRREIKGRNIPRMTSDQILELCGVLLKFGVVGTKEKLKKARDKIRREKGKCDGRHAYGEKPGEDLILARMKEMRGQTPPIGYEKIAAILNGENIPTRMGKTWKTSTIHKILTRGLPKVGKSAPINKPKCRRKKSAKLFPQNDKGGIWVAVIPHGQELRKIDA
jgi:hypothetical protein